MSTHATSSAQRKTANKPTNRRKANGKYLMESDREWVANKDKLLDDFRALISDGEALLHSTAHLSEDAVNVARDRFEMQWNQAKAKLDDAQNSALEQGHRVTTAVEDYVNENPWKTIGIAGGIGFFMGLLLFNHR